MTKQPNIYITASRFNQSLVQNLVTGAQSCLKKHNYQPAKEVWVSGAFELPHIASQLIHSKKCDAIISLGVVIKGDTPHFDYVCQGVTQGLMHLICQHSIAIGFGIVMTNTPKQAQERASLTNLQTASDHHLLQSESNKGYEAALAVIESLQACNNL